MRCNIWHCRVIITPLLWCVTLPQCHILHQLMWYAQFIFYSVHIKQMLMGSLISYIFIIVPQIIQPPVDFYTITFDESSNSVQLMCSLNVIIPSSVKVIWTLNGNPPPPGSRVIQTGNTTTLLIESPQPLDAGQYSCIFGGLYLQRCINLYIG